MRLPPSYPINFRRTSFIDGHFSSFFMFLQFSTKPTLFSSAPKRSMTRRPLRASSVRRAPPGGAPYKVAPPAREPGCVKATRGVDEGGPGFVLLFRKKVLFCLDLFCLFCFSLGWFDVFFSIWWEREDYLHTSIDKRFWWSLGKWP